MLIVDSHLHVFHSSFVNERNYAMHDRRNEFMLEHGDAFFCRRQHCPALELVETLREVQTT